MSSHGSSSPASPDHSSASQRYEVLERCGEGKLFVVYKVRERASLGIFALKALRQSYATHAEFCTVWRQVARANLHRQLSHFAFIQEVGTEDGTPYLVEEWLPGHSLEERLRRAPFGQIETVTLARHMAQGLAQLHQQDQVHGDFRPAQVLFTAHSQLKITDCGWEQAVHAGNLALTDVFPQSAFYQAPEVWNGAAPSAASDMYSLGVVLYQMLTGKLPFTGSSPLALAKAHQQKLPVAPSKINASCAPQLEAIVLGLLDKNPLDRPDHFANLTELRHEQLSPVAAPPPAAEQEKPQEPVEPKPAKKKPKMTRKQLGKREFKGAVLSCFWMLVAIGLLVGLVYGAMIFWVDGAPPEVRIPNYVGMNQTDAQNVLQAKGLKMTVGSEVYDPKKPSGTVIKGQPRQGTVVRRGRTIYATVSRGKEPIRMFDFRGLTLKQVRRIAQKHGLRLGQVTTQYDDQVPKNVIIAQFPQPKQYFHRYDPISLVISKGPASGTSTQTPEEPEDSAPSVPQDSTPATTEDSSDNAPLSSREVQVKITMPPSSQPQLVTIVVDDATGTHTVYSKMRDAGDVLDQTVRVATAPGTKATVQVFAGGQLLREMDF